jgi:outer membrane murein-binding lipoprotein Lpp
MKSFVKLGAVILPLALLTACANTAEMDQLKASVAAAQSTADVALSAAKRAQDTADTAQRTASSAELAALKAQETADQATKNVEECCAKIDRMFEKAMSK